MDKLINIPIKSELSRHQQILLQLLNTAIYHQNIVKVCLSGSLSKGGGDKFSDIDLTYYCSPESFNSLWTQRAKLVSIDVPVLFDMNHQWGKTDVSASYAVLYDNGIYLDLTIKTVDASQKNDVVLWFENNNHHCLKKESDVNAKPLKIENDPLESVFQLFWLGSTLCAKYIVREDLWNALSFIQSRRDLIIRAYRLVYLPEHSNWGGHSVQEDIPKDILEQMELTVTEFSRERFSDALIRLLNLMNNIAPSLAKEYGISYSTEATIKITTMIKKML
jgi:predicted nucleotidyltransferase